MNYLIYNLTNYGDGIYFLGTTRSKALAEKIVNALGEENKHDGTGYNYSPIESLDKYDPEALLQYALNNWQKES